MSLIKTWYPPQEAADSFGIDVAQVLGWVAEGLVRSEPEGDQVALVNIDDVRLEVEAMIDRG